MLNYEGINDLNFRKIISRFGQLKKIRICYLSVYSKQYARTEYIENLVRRNKIKAIFIHEYGTARHIRAIYRLIKLRGKYDVILLAFRAHEILPLVKLFSGKPIIFDALISIYDTLCFDRSFFKPQSLIGKGLKKLETFLLKIPDFILVDTQTHMEYFCKEFNIPSSKIGFLYVGCNKKNFRPIKIKKRTSFFKILWYGEGLPVQGVDIILKTAKLLEKQKGITFHLIGPLRKKYSKLINKLNLNNVKFTERVPYNDLPKEIATADLCLGGHFSNSPKAKRVISIKSFEFTACKKPIILGDNLATRELFIDSKKTIFCKMNDEKALAEAILLFKTSQKNLIIDKK